MAGVDGVKMPKVTDWKSGPGDIVKNGAPWEEAEKQFQFVESFAKLRPQVRGAGNLERFDYWLNTYRAAESMGHVGCLRGDLDRTVNAMKNAKDAGKKTKLVAAALSIRVRLAREWETLMSRQTAATDTPGELGTLANLEMHSRGTLHILDAHDTEIAAALGTPLPAGATPSASYGGASRIVVSTVRTRIEPGESLKLKVMVLDNQPAKTAALFWREMGRGEFKSVDLRHIVRAMYTAAIPAATEDLEYYVAATTQAGEKLVWPATAPAQNQTVVIANASMNGNP